MPRLVDLMAGNQATPGENMAAPPESTGLSIASLSTPKPAPPAPSFSIGDIAKDMAEGAIAPFVGDYHAIRGILADPSIHILPTSIQDEELRKAEEQGWKGAAFWGSALAGGGAGGLAASAGLSTLAKGAIIGGVGTGSFKMIEDLPDIFHGTLPVDQALKDAGTMSVFGALTGGAIAKTPGAVRATGRGTINAANKAIDAIPGGAKLREHITQSLGTIYANIWDRAFTSGNDILRKAGLGGLAQSLTNARTTATMLGGKWAADHAVNFSKLSRNEVRQVAEIMEKFSVGEIPEAGVYDMRLMTIAEREAKRLKEVGDLFQKYNVRVFDPERGLHVFVPRKDFAFPHRFVNPNAFRKDSEVYELAVQRVMKGRSLPREDAEAWLENFANRLQGELEGVVNGKPVGSTAGSYLKGRSLNLPGFSEDLDQILPQYYENAARRLTNHIFFGDTTPVEVATRKAATAAIEGAPAAEAAPAASEAAGEAVEEAVKKALTPGQIVFKRSLRAMGEAKAKQSIEFKYPKAFALLETVENPTLKSLSENILRRQLGAIESVSPGLGQVMSKAMYLEVISKLALGAIAQPSQVLTGVARTQYRGAFRNLIRTFADPEAHDFALRSGSILMGVVRQSEQSLTGGETEFLRRVGFTQLDMKSRIFGALQGASFAEHNANKLAMLAVKARTPRTISQMAKIEKRLLDLGLDPKGIVERGGNLTEQELLKAANKVSGDVNFWGDALSLPEFWKSPAGRYLTQFKSFAFQQTKLVKDHLVKPAMKGDWGPLTRFALLAPVGGEIIGDVKALVRARGRRDQSSAERILEDYAQGAGFGLAYDAFNATKYGTGGTMGFALGPSAGGTVPKTITAIGEASRGKPKHLARIAIETGLPYAAAIAAPGALPAIAAATPAISNILIPKEQR